MAKSRSSQITPHSAPTYTQEQKDALAGRIPMTEALFWQCLDVSLNRLNRPTFCRLLKTYPQYLEAMAQRSQRSPAAPNQEAPLRKQRTDK